MVMETLAQVFWSRTERSADRPAQQFKRDGEWRVLTWRQLGQIVHEIALGLIALGRQRGDAVALLSASRAEWVQADLGILSAGCLTIPIYPSYPPDLIAYIVNDSDARTLIVEDPDAPDSRALMTRFNAVGLPAYAILRAGAAPPVQQSDNRSTGGLP